MSSLTQPQSAQPSSASGETVPVKRVHLAQLVSLLNLSCRRGAFELQEAHAIYSLVTEVQRSADASGAAAPDEP